MLLDSAMCRHNVTSSGGRYPARSLGNRGAHFIRSSTSVAAMRVPIPHLYHRGNQCQIETAPSPLPAQHRRGTAARASSPASSRGPEFEPVTVRDVRTHTPRAGQLRTAQAQSSFAVYAIWTAACYRLSFASNPRQQFPSLHE